MIAVSMLLLAVASAVGPPATGDDEAPVRLAIVVGYDGPVDGERPVLSYADDDAARVYLTMLQESDRAWLLTTFDANSQRLFPELATIARPPTRTELAQVLGEAFWRVRALKDSGRKTELVFYFAGHGDVSASGEGFLVLADGTLSRTELGAQVVRGSPADVNHLLIDACASYFMVAQRGPADATAPAVPLSPALRALLTPTSAMDQAAWDRTGALVSTSDSSSVHESGALGSGIFSYLLRSALAGAADINSDGRIEYAEAAAFIAAAADGIDNPEARLRVFAKAPAQRPHAALSDLRRGGERRFLAIDVAGIDRVQLLDEHGTPYAEVHRVPGPSNQAQPPVVLALYGSAYFVVRVGTREATLVPRRAGAYALSSLHFESRPLMPGMGNTPSPDGHRGAAGAFRGLFERAYSPAFVAGWLASSNLAPPLGGPAFTMSFADGAEPQLRFPWAAAAVGSFVAAGAFATVSGASAVMNLVRFQEAQEAFDERATVDGALAFEVEAWRTTSTVTGALGLGVALIGVGMMWAGAQVEEEL